MARLVSFTPLETEAASGTTPDIRTLIDQAADRHGVSRQLAQTVARIESNYNPDAESPVGAQGVMQLMPATARGLGVRDSFDAADNINGGVKLLAQLTDRYGGDTRHILAAYNAGPGAVDKYGGVPPYRETKNYVAKGMQDLPENVRSGTAARTSDGADISAGTTAPPASPTVTAQTSPAADLFSRLVSGEQVTPETLTRLLSGGTPAPAPAKPAEEAPLTIVKSWTPVAPPPPKPLTITDALKNESFLDSAWNAVKSIVAAPKSILTGEYQQLAHQQLQQQAQLAKSGTPEQKRAWARDVFLQNIPFASTVYKALYGNLPGAAGDITGFAALGTIPELPGVAKEAAQDIARMVTAPVRAVQNIADIAKSGAMRDVIGIVSPRAGNVLRTIDKLQRAREAYQAATGTPAEETAAAGEAAAAPAAAPKAVPTVPVTGATDDALVQLYATESDPVKRAALRTELVNRGLISKIQPGVVAPEANPYRTYTQSALQRAYQVETDAAKRTLMEQAARDNNLSLMSREARRATVTPPETGFAEPLGPSLTQDEAAVLRYLGYDDPHTARVEDIATARKLIADDPQLLAKLRKPPQAPAPQPVVPPAAAPAPVEPSAAAPATPAIPTLDEITMGYPGGKPYAKSTPADQASARSIRDALERQAKGTTEAPAPPYVRPAAPAEPPVAPGKTAAEMLQEEIAAKRAQPPPAAIPENVTAAEGKQAFEQAKSEQPQIAEPGRTQYTATGEVKSPALRGAEIKLRNIEAKAQRWSQALRALGLTPADVPRIQPGWVSAEAQAAGAAPGWENVMHDLIGRGLLDKGERRPPVESLDRIQELMRNTPAAAKAEFQAAKSAPPKK